MASKNSERSTTAFEFPKIADMLATGTAISVAASIVYNFGYFYTLGTFREGYITFGDVIDSSLFWVVPAIFLGVAPYFAGDLVKIIQRKPNGESSPPDPTRPRAALIAVGGAIGLYISYGFRLAPAVVFLILFAWAFVFPIDFLKAGLDDRLSQRVRVLIYFLPVLAIASFLFGMVRAESQLEDTTYADTVTFTSDAARSTPAEHVNMFLYSERGILYRKKSDSQIYFSRWEDVRSIAAMPQPVPTFWYRRYFRDAYDWLFGRQSLRVPSALPPATPPKSSPHAGRPSSSAKPRP